MDSVAILLGWPSLGLALLLALIGAKQVKPWLIWLSVALTAPVALYLSASPAYPFIGILPLGALTLAALTCRRHEKWPAQLGIGSFAAFLIALVILVDTQRTPQQYRDPTEVCPFDTKDTDLICNQTFRS